MKTIMSCRLKSKITAHDSFITINKQIIIMKKLTFLLLLLLSTTAVFAQDPSVQMDDALRANGKIYVVVAVLAIIFTGIAIYLFTIDRRLKKIEKEK